VQAVNNPNVPFKSTTAPKRKVLLLIFFMFKMCLSLYLMEYSLLNHARNFHLSVIHNRRFMVIKSRCSKVDCVWSDPAELWIVNGAVADDSKGNYDVREKRKASHPVSTGLRMLSFRCLYDPISTVWCYFTSSINLLAALESGMLRMIMKPTWEGGILISN
jgi:hypothetical protein